MPRGSSSGAAAGRAERHSRSALPPERRSPDDLDVRAPQATWSRSAVARGAAMSALRTAGLLRRRQLHIDRLQLGRLVETEHGSYEVFRVTSCERSEPGTVTLLVWFHLRTIPA